LKEGIGGERQGEDRVTLRITLLSKSPISLPICPRSSRTESQQAWGLDGNHLVAHQPDDSIYWNPVMTQLWMNAS